MSAIPLSVPRSDSTAATAIERTARRERPGRLEVSIEEWVGPQLIAAFLRCANAYFTGRDAQ